MERNHLLMLLKLGKNYRSFNSRNYQAYAISYAVRDWLISCIQLKFSKKRWKRVIEVWVQVRADIQATVFRWTVAYSPPEQLTCVVSVAV